MSKWQASDALSQQLNDLVAIITEANFPGSLEGLFAFHILEPETSFPLSWVVNNAQPAWLEEHEQELGHFPVVAALGYSLYHWNQTATRVVREAFAAGVRQLEQRELFPDDGYSFINIPATCLGIVLGSLVAFSVAESEGVLGWLRGALHSRQEKGISDLYQRLIYIYAGTLLDGVPAAVNLQERRIRLEELALLEWGWRRGAFRLSGAYQDISAVRSELLKAALVVPMSHATADKAATIWSAIHSSFANQLPNLSQTTLSAHLNLEVGLQRVRNAIATFPADIRTEFATLEARLLNVLDEEDRFGINEAIRSERVRVLSSLNRFCVKHLDKTFNEYCS